MERVTVRVRTTVEVMGMAMSKNKAEKVVFGMSHPIQEHVLMLLLGLENKSDTNKTVRELIGLFNNIYPIFLKPKNRPFGQYNYYNWLWHNQFATPETIIHVVSRTKSKHRGFTPGDYNGPATHMIMDLFFKEVSKAMRGNTSFDVDTGLIPILKKTRILL
jgi:hypothetical protein